MLKPRFVLSLLLGVAVLVGVLMAFDLGAVKVALLRAGIGGFVIIVAAGLLAEVVLALGLVPLLPAPAPLTAVIMARQLRDSSGDVLPITQLGGVAFAARALVLAGMSVTDASAVVIADLTTETFAQGLYVLTGVLASLSLLHGSPQLSPYVGAMLGGALLLSLGSIGFAILQLAGSRWAEKLGGKLLNLEHAQNFHRAVHIIYRRHGRVVASILLQWAGWLSSGVWLWVVLTVMGTGTSLWAAMAVQALVEGLRSALVFVPASVGVQEAGYAVLGPVFGFTAEVGLAASLLRRARDLVVAVPVLLLWQWVESRRATR